MLLGACAAGDARFADDPAGFWQGLWHGVIAGPAFIVGLFAENVEIYERNNSGGWYDFGFLFGLTTIASGGTHGARSSSSKVRDVNVVVTVEETQE